MESSKKFIHHIIRLNSTYLIILTIFLATVFFMGCRQWQEGVLASVNGEEILEADFIEFYNSRPRIADWSSKGGKLDPNQVLNALVDKVLMEQKAREKGFDSSLVTEGQLKKIEEKVLVDVFIRKWFDPKVHITEEEVHAMIPDYQKKEIKFARICVFQEEDALEIKKKLDQGEDFSRLARLRSIGIDAEQGGIGDFLTPHRGIYPKKVIEKIFNIPIGEVSQPQQIREGYALFKPIAERPLNSAEMEQVVQYQRSLLFREKKNKLIRDLIERAKKEREVTIHDDVIQKIASQNGLPDAPSFNPILADGEDIKIYWRDILEILPRSPSQNQKNVWEDPNMLSKIIETKINKQMMVLEARKAGFDQDPDLKKELGRFEQDLLARQLILHEVERKLDATDEDCRKYYQENQSTFSEPEMVRVGHILLKDQEKANEVLSKLKEGEKFSVLAEHYSEYKITSRKGGDMGYIRPGESGMGYQFDQIAFSLQIAQISEVIETPIGYQIITVTDRKPARTILFEEARDKIRKELINQKRKAHFNAYLKNLRNESDIRINQDLFLKLRQDLLGTGS